MGANAIEQKRNDAEMESRETAIYWTSMDALGPQDFLPNLGAVGSNPAGCTKYLYISNA